jgi:hypothetical protein
METKVEGSCNQCGKHAGLLKVYRDPFGTAYAPGRWPTLTMHSDCFLAYVGERQTARLSNTLVASD